MKHIRIFIRKLSAFGDEVFNIFEQACFRNVLICSDKYNKNYWVRQVRRKLCVDPDQLPQNVTSN